MKIHHAAIDRLDDHLQTANIQPLNVGRCFPENINNVTTINLSVYSTEEFVITEYLLAGNLNNLHLMYIESLSIAYCFRIYHARFPR